MQLTSELIEARRKLNLERKERLEYEFQTKRELESQRKKQEEAEEKLRKIQGEKSSGKFNYTSVLKSHKSDAEKKAKEKIEYLEKQLEVIKEEHDKERKDQFRLQMDALKYERQITDDSRKQLAAFVKVSKFLFVCIFRFTF